MGLSTVWQNVLHYLSSSSSSLPSQHQTISFLCFETEVEASLKDMAENSHNNFNKSRRDHGSYEENEQWESSWA
jgi:hypothetical protein